MSFAHDVSDVMYSVDMGSYRVLLGAGSNARGQLGIGSYDDVRTFTPCRFQSAADRHSRSSDDWQLPDRTTRVAQIACGANHTVLLLENDDGSTTLWGAGDGRRGQLGEMGAAVGGTRRAAAELPDPEPLTPLAGSTLSSNVFRQLILPVPGGTYVPCIVAAAWETTYVVFTRRPRDGSSALDSDSDVLVSMGSNDFGALGVDTGEPSDTAVQRTRSGKMARHDGGGPGAPRVVALDHVLPSNKTPQAIRVRSLHAGPRHVIAELVVTGSSLHSRTILVGWGVARHGQLGRDLSGARFVAHPTLLPIDVHEDPMVSCALGNQHTVILHASGRISTFGSNKQGQTPSLLGSRRHICRLGCTWNGTYMQTDGEDGQVLLSMGNNAQGQLGRGPVVDVMSAIVDLPSDRAISTFVCGSEHVLVAMSDSVLGWGWNEHGNMGLGHLDNVAVPTKLWPRENIETYGKCPQRVVGIWAGCATSWLLVE